ncbi:MAG: 4Fe-4S ferredoxin N-terminal domain-containing protein [Halobacteriota archaeon]
MSDPPNLDDEPLLPEATDWEDRITAILDGEDSNEEAVALGREMARDALRVSKGELSDEEFNAMYEKKVQRVFGTEPADFNSDAADEE